MKGQRTSFLCQIIHFLGSSLETIISPFSSVGGTLSLFFSVGHQIEGKGQSWQRKALQAAMSTDGDHPPGGRFPWISSTLFGSIRNI